MSAGEPCRHVVGFLDFIIDIFLEVQDNKYSETLDLIDYIDYGLHSPNKGGTTGVGFLLVLYRITFVDQDFLSPPTCLDLPRLA